MKIELDYTKHSYEGSPSSRAELRRLIRRIIKKQLSEKDLKVVESVESTSSLIPSFGAYQRIIELASYRNNEWGDDVDDLRVYCEGGLTKRTEKIFNIANQWKIHGRIGFIGVEDIDQADLRLSFANTGNWSWVGTEAKSVPKAEYTINLGSLSTTLDQPLDQHLILHEFGHALGLVHEHQIASSPIMWNRIHIYWWCLHNLGWDMDTVDRNFFRMFREDETNHSSGFDDKSVMMYRVLPGFALNWPTTTLNYELSRMDQEHIGHIYPKRPDVLHS